MGEGEAAEDLRSEPAHCSEGTGGFLWYHLDQECPLELHCNPCPESWTFHHLTTFGVFTPVDKIKVRMSSYFILHK